jgi:hypothetical protein
MLASEREWMFLQRGTGASTALELKSVGGGGNKNFHITTTGRVIVPVLEITGGADIAEHFPVSGELEPGTVLSIDSAVPGRLRICTEAMSRTVAGVVSGAGDLAPGVLLGQRPIGTNSAPVAISGRVWVKADATSRPIRVGDLLVSAGRAGHAAALPNPTPGAGCILGKAMSGLERGTGMVLVLVSLQ